MDHLIGRRTFLTAAGLGGLGATGILAGCAAVSSARPFLTLLGEKAVEGIGLTVGTELGEAASSLSGKALDRLGEALGAEPDATIYGYAPDLDASSPWSFFAAGLARSENESIGERNFEGAMDISFGTYRITVPAILALGFFYYTATLFAESVAGKALTAAQRARQYRALRERYAIDVYETSDGDWRVTKSTTIQVVTAAGRNLEVEWDPTTERTEQSRLVVREGIRLKDEDPAWDRTEKWGIPSHRLWDIDT